MSKQFIIVFVITLIILLSCDSDSTSSSEKYTLSGNAKLLDLDGNEVFEGLSNVSVMVYDLIEIDSDLLQVKEDYPFIGSDVNQEVFFDIRDENPIQEASCTDNGSFSLSLEKGVYNIVVYSEDYGYKILFEYNLDSDSSINDITLYEIQELSGAISNFTFQTDHVYHITDDLVIQENSNVVFQAGTHIDVADNTKIYINDTFNLTSNGDKKANFNSIYHKNQDKVVFSGIEVVKEGTISFLNVIIKNSSSAMLFQPSAGDVIIESCVFINNNNSITSNNNDSFHVINSQIFSSNGIGVFSSSNSIIKKSILFDNNIGYKISMANTEVVNNYFLDNFMGVRTIGFEDQGVFNNEFDMNDLGISVSGSSPVIENNVYKNDKTNIELNPMFLSTGSSVYSNPSIKNNNFNKLDRKIIDTVGSNIEGHSGISSSMGISSNLDVTNNYWASSEFRDLSEYDTDLNSGHSLLFDPVSNYQISDAGIIDE